MKAFLIFLLLAGLGTGGFFGYKYLEENGKLPWQEVSDDDGGDPSDDPGMGRKRMGTAEKLDGTNETAGDPIAEMYPIPKFQTVEELTENWTKIPPRVFPRKVVTKEPVKIANEFGSSNLPEGKEMIAVGMEDGQLILAMNETSTAKAKAPATATTIVDQINESYGVFKKYHIDRVMKQREAEKNRRENAVAAVPSGGSTHPKPVVTTRPTNSPSSDPRFKPMIDSINAKDTQEIRMKNIQSWRWGGKTKEGGQEYDCGLITLTIDTLFGAMDTEAMALIKNGKVVKWVYTGSGEEVP